MIVNKITTLRTPQLPTDAEVQAHFDALNADGYHLVGVDNLVGWYRFFWAKDIVEEDPAP